MNSQMSSQPERKRKIRVRGEAETTDGSRKSVRGEGKLLDVCGAQRQFAMNQLPGAPTCQEPQHCSIFILLSH